MKTIQAITAELLATDGTVPVSHVAPPQRGYVVGINGQGIVSTSPDPEQVSEWVASRRTLATQPAHHLGSWQDSETGEVYLDVVRVFAERVAAEDFGREQGEIAIYDLTHDSEIRL